MIVKSNANEYLLIGKKGELYNKGRSTFSFLFPGINATIVPATEQKTSFSLTQESEDGISLGFKGIVIYHIEYPEVTALKFDFNSKNGIFDLNDMINEICYCEIRDKVSHMTMNRCIHERKTTLSQSLKDKLQEISYRSEINKGWGIQIDIVQISQVYIVEEEIKKQLESELRNQLKINCEISDIETKSQLKKVIFDLDIKEKDEFLQNEKKEIEFLQQKLKIQKQKTDYYFDESLLKLKLEQRLDIEKTKLLNEKQKLLLEHEKILLKDKIVNEKLIKEYNLIKNENNMIFKRSKFEIKKQKLEIKQKTVLYKSLGTLFNNATLTNLDKNIGFDLITQHLLSNFNNVVLDNKL